MKYIVYKTTCLINNKIYIGVHKTEDPYIFDGYLGRGFFINRTHYLQYPVAPFHYALIKHGVNNFKREILHIFDTEEEAYIQEAELVTDDFINSSHTYNVSIGGKGRPRPAQLIYQFDFDGNLLKSYESALEVSKTIERDISNIYTAILQKRTCKGFLWSYNNIIDISEYYKHTTNNYYIYNTEGLLIEEFENSKDAIEFLNTDSKNLSRAVGANYKINGYFISTEKFDKLQITVSRLSGKVNRYTLEGDYIDSFSTVKEAKEKTGLGLTSLSTAIKLDRTCNGFLWTRSDYPTDKIEVKIKSNEKRKVLMLDLKGNKIKIFNSVSEASKEFSSCRSVLKGTSKKSGGYKFEYVT